MAQIRRRGPNSYTIGIYLGRGPDGKRKVHYETFQGTRAQAKIYAAELEVRLKRRAGPKAAAMNLAEYLDLWLDRIRDTVSDRRWETYRWHVSRLKPAAGDLSLWGLTSGALQDRLRSLKGAERTVRDFYCTVRTALRQAVAWGILGSDPTVGLRVPKVERREPSVLTPEELRRLLDAVRQYKHHLVIRLVALYGLRLGEVLGLEWGDVDFAKGILSVRRSVDCRRRKVKSEPKTAASRRTFAMDPETMDLLKAHREAQKKVAPFRKEADLIFRTPDGRPLKESAVRKTLNRALKRAGLKRVRLHDLRHSAGSILLEAGASLAAVAEFLGHSSPAVTAAVYAHAVRKAGSVADALESDKKADRRPKKQ
jgi:integrase